MEYNNRQSETVQLNIKVPASTAKSLKLLARAHHMPQSHLIGQYLAQEVIANADSLLTDIRDERVTAIAKLDAEEAFIRSLLPQSE